MDISVLLANYLTRPAHRPVPLFPDEPVAPLCLRLLLALAAYAALLLMLSLAAGS